MTVIPLNRRFLPSKDGETSDYILAMVGSRYAKTWADVLAKRRVVILAEAGSGKTTELETQFELQRTAGRYAFQATVQNVGSLGLDGALQSQSADLHAWRASNEPAWFFLDSIDEAKDRNVPLKQALKAVASGIAGHTKRAHIILSGRLSDWEFRQDLAHLSALLPIPPEDTELKPLAPGEKLVRIVRREKSEPPKPAEDAQVLVMAPLDRSQVEKFIRENGVADVDAFLRALDRAHLWSFARRPLDLGWLVDYWRVRGAFGSLGEMIDTSLRQRLREPDPQRARDDSLGVDHAFDALERIGAALVLQRMDYVEVPDSSLKLAETRRGLDLGPLLQEWSSEDLVRLINRAAFDPIVAGLVRLHHDNEGVVRSYLAAKWLQRLLDNNCPKSTVMDLLFATSYELDVVIPSMRETSAWLSLTDRDVASEVIRRDPMLLLSNGDPASLPLAVRERVLNAVIEHIQLDDRFRGSGQEGVQRFTRPDMAPAIRKAWKRHSASPAVRELLLKMVWLGEIGECADLAVSCAFGRYSDFYTSLYAGRALMATASAEVQRRYLKYLEADAATVVPALLSDAVDEFFPRSMRVDELLHLLQHVDLAVGTHRFERLLKEIPSRLDDITQLEKLVNGLMARVPRMKLPDGQADGWLDAVLAASLRIFDLLPKQNVSVPALDAALLVIERRRYQRRHPELLDQLFASPERRRFVLYRAAEWFAKEPGLPGKAITSVWQLRVTGLPFRLSCEDLPWLLEDARTRGTASERRLAADGWMQAAWTERGQLVTVDLEPLRAITAVHEEVAQVIREWTDVRQPSEEELSSRRELERLEQQNAVEQAQREKSWAEFYENIRKEPEQLCSIGPPRDSRVDWRLVALWELLSAAGENRSHFSIGSLDALAGLFDRRALQEIGNAFVRFWRNWKPKLRSERAPAQRQQISNFDQIGMVGIALEAAMNSQWAQLLTHEDAMLATRYATLELNVHPDWLKPLALAQPRAVAEVLFGEILFEMSDVSSSHADTLEAIARAGSVIEALVADTLLKLLQSTSAVPAHLLDAALQVVVDAKSDPTQLEQYLVRSLLPATPRRVFAAHFKHLLRIQPAVAIDKLMRTLSKLTRGDQIKLVQAILPQFVGDGLSGDGDEKLPMLSPEILVKVIRLAYGVIRVAEDNDHSDGQAYSPDERDDAESARERLLKQLIDTPGRATIVALRELAGTKGFPISGARFERFVLERAQTDVEYAPWTSEDVRKFESDYSMQPHSAHDLHRLALRRIADLQHDAVNSDFQPGRTLALLSDETQVQLWIADRLEATQGRSYSVERESQAADAKEPDIRLRARASTAAVPIEVKVVETWSFVQLVAALEAQLVRQYLRDRKNRYGILLLVHQSPRPQGWRGPRGRYLTLSDVLQKLQKRAREISARDSYAPQPAVVLIDVSSLSASKKRKRTQKPATVAGRNTRRAAARASSPPRSIRATNRKSTREVAKKATKKRAGRKTNASPRKASKTRSRKKSGRRRRS